MNKTLIASAVSAALLLPLSGLAQTVTEQSAEHRYQLDFHVNEAALAALLPRGWEAAVATQGPAKDCNLRLIFIDRMAIFGSDGKASSPASERLVYLAVPVKQPATGTTGQMILHGLTDNAAEAPGWFGVYELATAETSRSSASHKGRASGREDWAFTAASGERLTLHVEYERGATTKGGGETKFFHPGDPTQFQVFRTDQTLDIQRNATTSPPDHVRRFSYTARGGKLAALFDGTEKVVSWDLMPSYTRTITTP
jgi:hypothetical protein